MVFPTTSCFVIENDKEKEVKSPSRDLNPGLPLSLGKPRLFPSSSSFTVHPSSSAFITTTTPAGAAAVSRDY
jgi:hypothetical protein